MNQAEGLAALKSLYRSIMRLHRDKLPGPMRELGDAFVSTEFKTVLRNPKTTQEHWRQFAEQWQGYIATLAPEQHAGGTQSATAHVAERLDDYLDSNQKKRLEELKKEVTELGRSMHAQMQPQPGSASGGATGPHDRRMHE